METITNEEREVLTHMLGADSRYKKRQWGFRNHFVASPGHHDFKALESLEAKELVKRGTILKSTVFWATKAGAIAIGFKAYQLRKTDFPVGE